MRYVAGLVTAVLIVGGAVLGLHVGNLHNGLIAASFTAVGLFVIHRRPGNREGRLFVATGVAHAVMFAGRQYALHPGPLPGASWAGWLGVWPLPLVLVLVSVTVLSFPSGRLPSRPWRFGLGALAVVGLALAAVSAFWPVEYARTALIAPHPSNLAGAATADAFYRIARPAGYLLFQLAGAAGLVLRLWRARGDEARQLRWLVFASVLAAAVMVVGLTVWGSPLPGALVVPIIPVAAGAAILKYRLYDIDPVINKSLVFGAMAAVVTLGYAVVVTGVGRLVDGYGTLLATAIVAVAFEPLRRRVQRWADRVVYGHRATPYEALARLSAQLTAPAGGLLDGICRTVADGVGGREVVLWTGPPDRLQAVSIWPATTPLPTEPRSLSNLTAPPQGQGEPAPERQGKGAAALRKQDSDTSAPPRQGDDATTLEKPEGPTATPPKRREGAPLRRGGWKPSEQRDAPAERGPRELSAVMVVHDGRFLGGITVRKGKGEVLSGLEKRLVGDLAAQAGLVLELQATAQRLVRAGDAARRRLERDLHDGAQQRLVTVALELGAVVRLASDSGNAEVAQRADAVRTQLLEATAELREMARGLHPAVLTQDGLEAAVGFLADRSAVPVRLTVKVDRRLPPEVESTAYFVVSEGLTNAAKHGGASLASVRAELTDGGLVVEVADDGGGGAAVRPGSGLEGLADRLATLGARLVVDSGPSGTRLATVIPCG